MWRPKLIGYDDQFGGLQCILVDQMANAIQATVKEIDYDLIGTKIKAGCIYEITHFHSARSKTSHKVVPHAAHLFFNTRTVFTELSSVYPQIPRHRFYFLDYGQLAIRIDKNEILTDVLGHITAVQPLEEKMVGNGRLETKCEIYIQNVRKEDVRITLWGDTARAFDFQALEELAPPIITIFTSLKVKQFQGKTVLNSSVSTMIFIDPDIQELEAYKMTFGAFANAIRMVPPSSIQPIKPEELETAKKLSVQELNVLDPDLSKAHVFKSSYRCAAFLANYDTNYSVEVRFGDGQYDLPPWSISILPDCKNAVYNTARLGAQSSQMKMTPVNNALSWQSFTEETASSYDPDTFTLDGLRDQINMTWDSTDYLWYMTDITISPDEGFLESGQSPLLTIGSAGHALHVFINGQLSGTAYGSLEKRRLRFSDNVKLRSGVNKLALLSVSLGLPNIGIHFETWNVGVLGPVTLRGLNSGTWDLSQRKWTYRVGLKGEALSLHTVNGSSSVEWVQKPYLAKKPPLTWYKATFDAPSGNDPLALDMVSMGKGQIWINGRSIGRHWPAYTAHGACRDCYYAGTYNENKCRTKCGEPSQRWYHVPRGWLNPSGNLLVVFEEWGGEPTKIALVQRATSSVCADIFEGQPTLQSSQKLASAKLIKAKAHLRCQPGQIISDIKFASYGWPQGTCGSFKEGSCHAHKSYDFPRRVCIGKQFCTIPVAPAYFGGDPCPGSAKKFSVEAVCS